MYLYYQTFIRWRLLSQVTGASTNCGLASPIPVSPTLSCVASVQATRAEQPATPTGARGRRRTLNIKQASAHVEIVRHIRSVEKRHSAATWVVGFALSISQSIPHSNSTELASDDSLVSSVANATRGRASLPLCYLYSSLARDFIFLLITNPGLPPFSIVVLDT